jgi:cellulose synthase (UDP-forming)
VNPKMTIVPHQAWWHFPARILAFLFGSVALGLLATVPLRWDQQAVFGLACIVLAVLVSKCSRSSTATIAFAILAAFSTTRYAYWRISETYNYLSVNWSEARALDLAFVFALLAAEAYAFVILFLGFFQTARPLKRKPVPMPEDTNLWPSVDVYIPTYNEPLEVVRTTVLAALSIDWPAQKRIVYILDDGKRAEFEEFAQEVGCGYITRPDNKHAKAGNINHALKKTKGDYIAIFDCDHIPTRSFLQVTMGWFLKDARLGMLQTPHHFYSPDPFERNLGTFRDVPNEGALFYGVIQDGSDLWNGAFFCGSCAVLRRTAVEEIGGIAVETVTEDAHTSLRMQRRSWNTAYLRLPQAAGLATGSLAAHIGQRIRWARGMVQILRTDNPLFGRGLKLPQRLCYLNSMLHFLYAIPRLMFLTSPLVYLLLGYSNIYGYGRAIFAYAIPHLAFAIITNSRVQGRYRYSFWNEIYEAVLAPYILLPTTVALISPKHGKFNVTSKSDQVDEEYFDWRLAAPYIVLLAVNLAAAASGVLRMINSSSNRETLAINVFWCLMNIVILGAATAVARESKQRRMNVRISARIPLTLAAADGKEWATKTIDISRGGFSVPVAKNFRPHAGMQIAAAFQSGGETHRFPAFVVDSSSKSSRFSFASLTVEEEQKLVRVIFGRADSWLDWRMHNKGDRPLISFLQILGIALQGIAAIPVAIVEALGKSPRGAADAEAAIAARNPALPSIVLLAGALLLCGLHPASLRAQSVEVPSGFKDSYDLASLGHKEPLLLKGTNSRTTLYFGIPVSKVVTQAKLRITYRSSVTLAPKISVIRVSLNGSGIGSIPVAPDSDADSLGSAEIELPFDLLTADNTLAFELQPKCAVGCDSVSPESLWFRIERTTQLELSGSVLPIANDLRLLPEPFFDSSTQRAATIKMAFAAPPDAHTLEASGVIASWLGTLADYRGIHFTVTAGSIPRGDVIAFVPKGSELMPDSSLNGLSGPAVALRDNPSDPYGKILVITGDDSSQILEAARAVASGRFPRDGDSAQLAGVQLPGARQPYDAPRWLTPGGKVTLVGRLGPEELKVYGDGSVNLYFRLAPDSYFGSRPYIPLQLNYQLNQWPESMKGEVRIKLNDRLVTSRPVKPDSGNGRRSERLGLPVQDLQPSNTLSVEFALSSDRPTAAGRTPSEQILRDSELDLSSMRHYVGAPLLNLFANAGFPFTKYADLSETAVVLGDSPSSEETSLYLALVALCGARTGYPALRVTVVHPDDIAAVRDKDLLIVGGASRSTSSVFVSGPARLDQGAVKLVLDHSLWPDLPWLRWNDQQRRAREIASADPSPTGFVSEFVSPYSSQRSVLSFQGQNGDALGALEETFAESSGLSSIYGDLSVLQGGQLHSFILNPPSDAMGDLRWDERCRVWAKNHYWSIPLFLFSLAFLLALPINVWLERKAALRLQDQI